MWGVGLPVGPSLDATRRLLQRPVGYPGVAPRSAKFSPSSEKILQGIKKVRQVLQHRIPRTRHSRCPVGDCSPAGDRGRCWPAAHTLGSGAA